MCVWISVKISPFATAVFFYPQSHGEAFEKELALSSRSKKSTHDMENGRTFSSTDKKACACVDFSFLPSTKTLKRRDIFLDGIFTSRHKKDKPSPGTILKEADEDNSHA